MNNIRHALHIARRYAEGGSDDSNIDPIVSIGGKPIANRPPPEALPPLPDNPDQKYAMPEESFTHGYEREFGPVQDWRDPTHRGVSDVVGGMGQDVTRPIAEGPTVQNVAGAAMAMPIVPPSAEGAAAEIGARATRKALAKDVAGQLVERYGDNHAAISERMLSLDPQDHNDVLAHLPPSVRSGVLDHRLSEANRLIGEAPAAEPQPNYWTEYEAAQRRSGQATRLGFDDKTGRQISDWLSQATREQVRNLHDDDLQELNDFFDRTPSAVARRQSLADAASDEDSVRAAAHAAGVSSDRTEEAVRAEKAEEAFRAGTPPSELTRQPGASRTGYVSPYGIHGGQAQLSDAEYEALKNPNDLTRYEGESYQGVPREQHPFYDVSRDAWNNYQKYIQPKLGNIQDFSKKFFGGYETRGLSFESDEHPEYGAGSMSFDGRLTDKGNHVADISVSINPATNSAHLGLLEIAPQYRGDAGPKLLRNQIDTYKQMGLDYVDLYAAGGGDPYGGSYAWAKYGFVPNQQDWDVMRQRFMPRLDNPQLAPRFAPADPEVKTIVRNMLNNRDPRTIWRLSDVTAPNGNGQPVGKTLLLSHGWSGQLTFKDPGAMRRFDAYIARPKKPKPAQ